MLYLSTERIQVTSTANLLATFTTTPDIVYLDLSIAGYTSKEGSWQSICTTLDYLVS